jgi:hypothetical protein
VSNLVISFGEILNPWTLGIIFLGLFFGSYLCYILELVVTLMTSSSSLKNISYEKLVAFFILEFSLFRHVERFPL